MAKQCKAHGEASAFNDNRQVLLELDLFWKPGAPAQPPPPALTQVCVGPGEELLELVEPGGLSFT